MTTYRKKATEKSFTRQDRKFLAEDDKMIYAPGSLASIAWDTRRVTTRQAVAAVLDPLRARGRGDQLNLGLAPMRGRVVELAVIPSRNQFQRRFEQCAVADLGLVLQPLDQRLKERSLISRQQRLGEVHQEMELRIGE